MISLTRFLGMNYDRGKIYRVFMITWFIFGEFLLDYVQYKKKYEIFRSPIGTSWFGDIIISAFVCLLDEIFELEKRNHTTKLCFYITRALTFDSFYITSLIILVKTMLDFKTGNSFLLDAAWIYTTLLYMAMYSLNDWLLIYHKIKKTENQLQQQHISKVNDFINILSSIFLFESTMLYLLMPLDVTPFCWNFMHGYLGANILISGYRREDENPSAICCIYLLLSIFLVTFKGHGRLGLKQSSPFFKVIHRIYIFSPVRGDLKKLFP